MGLLSRAYSAVDPYLPGDGLLDPMFGAQQSQTGAQPAHHGGLLSGLGTVAHVVDNVLGLGIGDAVHRERQAGRNADLKVVAAQILGDQTVDKATRLQRMRAAVADAAANGADVGDWVKGLDAAESQMNLLGLFPQGADGAPPPSLSVAAPTIAREYFRNPDAAKNFETFLKDLQPDVAFDNGVGYNKKDASNVGKFHPTLDKGQEPLYDSRGRIVAIRNMDGSVQSAAEMAGAVAGAQEGGKAAFDIVQVPMPDGSTQSMTRLQAAQLFTGGTQGGGQPGSPSLPAQPGIGRSQSPADATLARGNAETAVKRAADQPQEWSGLTDQARTTQNVIDYIDRALSQIDRLSAGPLAGTAFIPGSPARDLQATLDTIKSNVGFDKLQQMRNNSPTGGALGQVSEMENRLLQSVSGSLDQGQSPEQLKANLLNVRDQLAAVSKQRQQVYDQMYAPPSPTGPTMQGKGYKIISVQ